MCWRRCSRASRCSDSAGDDRKAGGDAIVRIAGVTVWLLTPIHLGYATLGAGNVQPDETYANTLGLWISDYFDVVKEAVAKWRSARLIEFCEEFCGALGI